MASALPNPNDPAATWPPEIAARARHVGARVLADFAGAAQENRAHFAVLYVPRGEDQLSGEVPRAHTFAPWLFETCALLALHCIDPSAALAEARRAGEPMYDDHWSPAGHAVIASVLRQSLAEAVRREAGR